MAAIKPKKGKVTGTKKNDKITWVSSKDWKKALTVNAGAGNDVINFKKSKYKNKLNGQAGNDTIYGGTKNDLIDGGAGKDKLYGYNGNDTIKGGKGDDYIDGGAGADRILGQYGTNTLKGGAGKDSIYGGTGTDKIYGGAGNDYINGGKGKNTIFINKGDGADTIVSGGGTDTLKFTDFASISALSAHLSTIKEGNDLVLYHGESDTVTIKNYFTSNSSVKTFMANDNKTISVDSLLSEKTFWLSGEGTITGTKYNDNIYGSMEDDTIYAGKGNDTISGGLGNNYIHFGAYDGSDVVEASYGVDTLVFDDVVSINDIQAVMSNDDLVITTTNGNTITLPDFVSYHSVEYVQIGNSIYEIADILPSEPPEPTDDPEPPEPADTITINGTDDNDTITRNDSKHYKIFGLSGKDSISSGSGNDTIYGGPGNDTISAGTGNNYIHFNNNDGNDTVDSGNGTDTLVFDQQFDIDDLNAVLSGNDLIVTTNNGNNITLANYKNGHSVQYVQVGDEDPVSIESIKNHINSSAQIVNGTPWHDDIYSTYQHTASDYPEIYAGAGNDLIHITDDTDYCDIYLGTGNDTVSIETTTMDFNMHFANGDGNNTLEGLNNDIHEYAQIHLASNDIVNVIDFGESMDSYHYIKGTKNDNDLIINLTGGETFTVNNYFSIVENRPYAMQVDSDFFWASVSLKYYLTLQQDIMTLPDNFSSANLPDNNKLIIAPDANIARTLTINGRDNTVLVKGQNTQTLNINADAHYTYAKIYNTGVVSSANKNLVNINSGENTVELSGGFGSTVTMADNLADNAIYIYSGTNNTVTTSNEGNTSVEVHSTGVSGENDGVCTINSYGTDCLYSKKGTSYINLYGNNDRYIRQDTSSAVMEINEIVNPDSATVTQDFTGSLPKYMMFSHYTGNRTSDSDWIDLMFADNNHTILNSDINKIKITGNWINDTFDLDNETVGNKVTIEAKNLSIAGAGGNPTKTLKLNELTQFVDMNSDKIRKHEQYDIKYYTLGTGVLDIAKDVYIEGTTKKDIYTCLSITDLDKQYTINDKGHEVGNHNNLDINELATANNFRYFFDVNTSGEIIGKDLYILAYGGSDTGSNLGRFIMYNADVSYIKIENFFGEGNDDVNYGTGYVNVFDSYNQCAYDSLYTEIAADVASWLTNYNSTHGGKDYDCISDAMKDGVTNGATALVAKYIASSYWSDNWE